MPHAIRAAWFDEYVEDMVMGLRGFHARLSLTEPRMLSDEELGNINVPVLYVAGAFEQMCSVQAAVDRLAAAAPLIETAVIPGAGHELPLGQPELLTQRVLEFLGKP
jgi:pimeloyl-ACP methyl ester carboxylesterase